MANVLQSICFLYLAVLVFFTSGETKTKEPGCKKCLLHCKKITPNTLGEGICRSCLTFCKHNTEDIFQFFKNHQCLTNSQANNFLQADAPTPSGLQERIETLQHFCERSNQDLVNSFTEFLIKYYTCSNDLNEAKKKAYKCMTAPTKSEDEIDISRIEQIFRENRSSSTNDTKLPNIAQVKKLSNFGMGEATARVAEITDADAGSEHERPACRTIHTDINPTYARRHSSGELVKLMRYQKLQQFFRSGRCSSNETITTLSPPGRCKTVYNLHKAFFELRGQRYDPDNERFVGCFKPRLSNETRIVCNDWVQIESACVFFV